MCHTITVLHVHSIYPLTHILIYLFLFTYTYISVVFIRDYSTDAKLAKEVGGQNYNLPPTHPFLITTHHSLLTFPPLLTHLPLT